MHWLISQEVRGIRQWNSVSSWEFMRKNIFLKNHTTYHYNDLICHCNLKFCEIQPSSWVFFFLFIVGSIIMSALAKQRTGLHVALSNLMNKNYLIQELSKLGATSSNDEFLLISSLSETVDQKYSSFCIQEKTIPNCQIYREKLKAYSGNS